VRSAEFVEQEKEEGIMENGEPAWPVRRSGQEKGEGRREKGDMASPLGQWGVRSAECGMGEREHRQPLRA
jgi:hypothetical protein